MQLRSGRIIEYTIVIQRRTRNVNVRNQRAIKRKNNKTSHNFLISFLSTIILSILSFIQIIISLCLSMLEFMSIALLFFYVFEICNELFIIYEVY